MDGIKYVVVTDKSIQLLVKNQYTSNVKSESTRTEIKHWVELFFGVKKMGPITRHTMHYRRMIITLQPSYSIPPLRTKRT
ncbi:hypothetical protein V6Z11_D04G032000 [Gossypium hirsutum]